MEDEHLYDQLDEVRAAYATATWEGLDALEAQQQALVAEIDRRSLERSRAQLQAAGLPVEWARP